MASASSHIPAHVFSYLDITMKRMLLASLMAAAVATTAFATYDVNTAFSALYYSKSAYCDQASLVSWDCVPCKAYPPKLTQVTVATGTYESQGYVGYNPADNQIVVAFRGSSNLPNWIANLDFQKVAYPACSGCEVHKGFYEVWLGQKAVLEGPLRNLTQAHPSATIFVTGHSLGAAVSAHAGVDIATMYPSRDVTVYNFGEPRTGNQAFAAWSTTVLGSGKQYRVTHKADPVPHLPPMSWGFLHIPHELWYNNNGNTSFMNCTDSASAEDPKCSDSTIPIDVQDHLLYLGISTRCNAGLSQEAFAAEVQAMGPLRMPKDYIRAPEEVRLM